MRGRRVPGCTSSALDVGGGCPGADHKRHIDAILALNVPPHVHRLPPLRPRPSPPLFPRAAASSCALSQPPERTPLWPACVAQLASERPACHVGLPPFQGPREQALWRECMHEIPLPSPVEPPLFLASASASPASPLFPPALSVALETPIALARPRSHHLRSLLLTCVPPCSSRPTMRT